MVIDSLGMRRYSRNIRIENRRVNYVERSEGRGSKRSRKEERRRRIWES